MRQRKETSIRQKEIAAAARKLIVKYGSENVTIKKMALEIGVSEAAIYRHFKSKRDILSFLIKDIGQTLFDDIEQKLRWKYAVNRNTGEHNNGAYFLH